MKRYVPFVIILAVALLTVVGGALFYKAKVRSPQNAVKTKGRWRKWMRPRAPNLATPSN